MHEFTKAIRAKGWTAKDLGERWGYTPRGMTTICRFPKRLHWDALNGIRDKSSHVQVDEGQ